MMTDDNIFGAGGGDGQNAAREQIRIRDRRRITLDSAGEGTSEAGEPDLKPTYVAELETRARAAEQQAQEIRNRFEGLRLQMQRETDETRQRLNRAADERFRTEKANLIASLLPVLDNLQRAIQMAEPGSSAEAPVSSVLEGVRSTAANFEAVLRSAGLEPISSVGERFDPELHEAVDRLAVEPARDGFVTAEYSKGYRMGERLVRPARVQVGFCDEMSKAVRGADDRF